ncbi:uncharacterized protein B0I36DRAFT_356943 [Microdochium trichocladiopsis]|uniref:Uncharacterized protein n=1 Tax=Microdochium trichocladiopsis TaxID=1682393 RepID=A0A9P8XP39_9PEZI|nr:uncharacterized protein B0I36DRAFT_356943 [Microdochium trichocladiopsis]KAH7007848.1 hypothetical protein B0I36DRAFT_356943 [Microdochium trichocladiopsis]
MSSSAVDPNADTLFHHTEPSVTIQPPGVKGIQLTIYFCPSSLSLRGHPLLYDVHASGDDRQSWRGDGHVAVTTAHIGVKLSVADYRHVAIELCRHIRRLVTQQLEVDMGDEANCDNPQNFEDRLTGEARRQNKVEYVWGLQATIAPHVARSAWQPCECPLRSDKDWSNVDSSYSANTWTSGGGRASEHQFEHVRTPGARSHRQDASEPALLARPGKCSCVGLLISLEECFFATLSNQSYVPLEDPFRSLHRAYGCSGFGVMDRFRKPGTIHSSSPAFDETLGCAAKCAATEDILTRIEVH